MISILVHRKAGQAEPAKKMLKRLVDPKSGGKVHFADGKYVRFVFPDITLTSGWRTFHAPHGTDVGVTPVCEIVLDLAAVHKRITAPEGH